MPWTTKRSERWQCCLSTKAGLSNSVAVDHRGFPDDASQKLRLRVLLVGASSSGRPAVTPASAGLLDA
jgi:hypothetical protein